MFGTPIINLPQTGRQSCLTTALARWLTHIAVLGLHAINDEVVVVNGKFEARPVDSIVSVISVIC